MNFKQNAIFYSLLFSALGVFSCLLLANNSGLPPQANRVISSTGGYLFFIVAFNLLGGFTLRISTWLNNQYALNIRRRWKIVFVYAVVMVLFMLLNYGLLVCAKIFAEVANPFGFPQSGLRFFILIWLIELLILGLMMVNRSMRQTLELEQQAAELQKENNTARYTALQNQLNPHFLFNSLNTLIAEIEYNPANAVTFTRHLSDVYRYVLQCQDRKLVTLREELEFAKSYLFLHQVRLGDCILWNSEIPENVLEMQLPPLTLQLLVENVIKHNSISPGKPMEIRLTTSDNLLVVSNPIHPRKSNASGGIGLKNLANRSKLISGKEIIVDDNHETFTVKIPLIDE